MAHFTIPEKMALREPDLKEILLQMERRHAKCIELSEYNAQHFHNDKLQDPNVGSFKAAVAFQSDKPRQIHAQLRARLVENHAIATVKPPRDTERYRDPAQRLEMVLNQALEQIERRLGFTLQGGLADGLIIKAAGVLHWRKAQEVYPDFPDNQYLDPEELNEDEADDYEALYQDDEDEEEDTFPYRLGADGMPMFDGSGMPVTKKLTRYRETDDSTLRRYQHSCAEAGFPMYVELVPWEAIRFLPDRSIGDRMAMVSVKREFGLLEYARKVNADSRTLKEANDKLNVEQEVEAPRDWEPSSGDWGEKITVYELWTRDEYYEVATGGTASWECTKAFRHPYKRCPFALAPASEITTSDDPALRYEPALAGIYRLKGVIDRLITLGMALAETTALPLYFLESIGNGEPLLDDAGHTVFLTKDAISSFKVPDGYKITILPIQMSDAFTKWAEIIKAEYDAAAPPTGNAEVTASTQPWTVRLEQAQQAITPGMYLNNIASCIREFLENVAYVMSLDPKDGGFATPPVVYKRLDNGKVDRTATVSVEPKEISTLAIDVEIKGTTKAEQVTLEQHGMELLQQGIITLYHFYKDYMVVDDPEDRIADKEAEEIWNQYIKPNVVPQKVAKILGPQYAVGPNLSLIGPGGKVASSAEVLQAHGQQPTPRPAGPPGIQTPQPGQAVGGQQPGLPSIQAPGALPLPGQSG